LSANFLPRRIYSPWRNEITSSPGDRRIWPCPPEEKIPADDSHNENDGFSCQGAAVYTRLNEETPELKCSKTEINDRISKAKESTGTDDLKLAKNHWA